MEKGRVGLMQTTPGKPSVLSKSEIKAIDRTEI
jgi:hypothetical protein